MSTTTHTYDASRLQWSNWELPADAETIALAAVRSSARSSPLQLGMRDPVDERLSEFESRLAAVSGKV